MSITAPHSTLALSVNALSPGPSLSPATAVSIGPVHATPWHGMSRRHTSAAMAYMARQPGASYHVWLCPLSSPLCALSLSQESQHSDPPAQASAAAGGGAPLPAGPPPQAQPHDQMAAQLQQAMNLFLQQSEPWPVCTCPRGVAACLRRMCPALPCMGALLATRHGAAWQHVHSVHASASTEEASACSGYTCMGLARGCVGDLPDLT